MKHGSVIITGSNGLSQLYLAHRTLENKGIYSYETDGFAMHVHEIVLLQYKQ